MDEAYKLKHRKTYNNEASLARLRPIIELKLRSKGLAQLDPAFILYPKGEEAHKKAIARLYEFSANDLEAAMITTRRLATQSTQIADQALKAEDEENILHVPLALKRLEDMQPNFLEEQIEMHDLSDYGMVGMRFYFPEFKIIQYQSGFHTSDMVKKRVNEAMAQDFMRTVDIFNQRQRTPFTGSLAGRLQVGSPFLPPLNFFKKEYCN